jgi:hypothetical protein
MPGLALTSEKCRGRPGAATARNAARKSQADDTRSLDRRLVQKICEHVAGAIAHADSRHRVIALSWLCSTPAQVTFVGLSLAGLRRRTSGPPPFSSTRNPEISLAGRSPSRRRWRKNLVDQSIICSFEWVDEPDALQDEPILQIFSEQAPHAIAAGARLAGGTARSDVAGQDCCQSAQRPAHQRPQLPAFLDGLRAYKGRASARSCCRAEPLIPAHHHAFGNAFFRLPPKAKFVVTMIEVRS